MNNPDKDRLQPFQSHTDTKKLDVKMVWLLNLIPYTGAGYFYAVGFKQAIRPMILIWALLWFAGPGWLGLLYIILSVLGTAYIIEKNTGEKLRQAYSDKDADADYVAPGQQIPLAQTSQYSLSTLESKAKKAAKTLKRIGYDEDEDKSKHAFETFEYKAQAAEKMLKARNEAAAAASSSNSFDPDPAINFAPAAAPHFSDEESDSNADFSAPAKPTNQSSRQASNLVPPKNRVKSTDSSNQQIFDRQQSDSSDYINRVNNSFSIDAEVSGITAGVSRGASADATEVNDFLKQADAFNDADLKLAQFGESLKASQTSEADMTGILASADLTTSQIQSPNVVPDISSQVAPSESYVPEVTAQYSTDPYPLPSDSLQSFSGSANASMPRVPDLSSQVANADFVLPASSSFLVNSEQSVPEVSSQLVNSTQVAPEVSSQLVNSTQDAPEVSSQLVNSTQVAPEVSSQWVNSTQVAPDVSSQLVNSTQVAPDVSSQLVNSTQVAPDISSQLVNSTQVAPDVNSQMPDTSFSSLGNFESPKFSFSFDDHMATPLVADVTPNASGTATAAPCPKCGAAKDSNFSFCLACGQSFL